MREDGIPTRRPIFYARLSPTERKFTPLKTNARYVIEEGRSSNEERVETVLLLA
jgi:hypothetical protein